MKLIEKYNIRKLKSNINKYGYKYSTKDFILQSLGALAFIFIFAYLSKLEYRYVMFLVLIGLLLIPLILGAWFKQLYNIKRFSYLSEYLSNIIPIFIQKTKIRYALGEILGIVDGQMKESVTKAINYLDNTTNDKDLSKNALKIIEDDFPNSRLKSVHKLLLNVEDNNSTNFRDIATDLYEDIEKWIKRVFSFQKDLKNRRNKLVILCLMILSMNVLFVRLYTNNEFLVGFTSSDLYQVSTTLFIASILITVTIVLTKLNGEWLVNDLTYKKDEILKTKYLYITKGQPKIKAIDILATLMFVLLAVYMFIRNKKTIAIFSLFTSLVSYTNQKRIFKQNKKMVEKSFIFEFPMWLREVSLSLNNMTVLNAIEYTINTVSYPLRKEIRLFLSKAKEDPTSIKPYVEFLDGYDIEEAKSSMKVLYAINNVSKSEIKTRISNLITRNEELIAKSETIRNDDSISGVETIGYVPALLFSLQTIVSMYLVFSSMMSNLGGLAGL